MQQQERAPSSMTPQKEAPSENPTLQQENSVAQGELQGYGGQLEGATPASILSSAAEAIAGGGGALPYMEDLQEAFGSFDVTGIQAHFGSDAGVGATAFAMGEHVMFASSPDLFTAAHEAAHVVQQRGGVSLPGGVGAAGDAYEKNADQVAAAVVNGESAEELLAVYGGEGVAAADQVQLQEGDGGEKGCFTGGDGGGLACEVAKGTLQNVFEGLLSNAVPPAKVLIIGTKLAVGAGLGMAEGVEKGIGIARKELGYSAFVDASTEEGLSEIQREREWIRNNAEKLPMVLTHGMVGFFKGLLKAALDVAIDEAVGKATDVPAGAMGELADSLADSAVKSILGKATSGGLNGAAGAVAEELTKEVVSGFTTASVAALLEERHITEAMAINILAAAGMDPRLATAAALQEMSLGDVGANMAEKARLIREGAEGFEGAKDDERAEEVYGAFEIYFHAYMDMKKLFDGLSFIDRMLGNADEDAQKEMLYNLQGAGIALSKLQVKDWPVDADYGLLLHAEASLTVEMGERATQQRVFNEGVLNKRFR